MGIGALRRHRDYGATGEDAEAEEGGGLQEPVSSHTKAELVEWLESQGYTLEDLEPGTGSSGNVVKADVVAAVEAVQEGEEPEPRGETDDVGDEEDGEEETEETDVDQDAEAEDEGEEDEQSDETDEEG